MPERAIPFADDRCPASGITWASRASWKGRRARCDDSQGSAIVVYDEQGNFVETITGFNFAIGEPAPVLNPAKRMGWAFGGPAGFSQLQQFFY
jgi:hypothetical protein